MILPPRKTQQSIDRSQDMEMNNDPSVNMRNTTYGGTVLPPDTFFTAYLGHGAVQDEATQVSDYVFKSKLLLLAFSASFQVILYLIYWLAVEQLFDRYLLFLFYIPFVFYYCAPNRTRIFVLAYAAICALKISIFYQMREHDFYWIAFCAMLFETFFLFLLIF